MLMLQLSIAKELGKTLSELNEVMTFDEILLWATFFDIQKDEIERASRRRS